MLEKANQTCFTVCFNAKVDIQEACDRLQNCTSAELQESKDLVRQLLSGK